MVTLDYTQAHRHMFQGYGHRHGLQQQHLSEQNHHLKRAVQATGIHFSVISIVYPILPLLIMKKKFLVLSLFHLSITFLIVMVSSIHLQHMAIGSVDV